MERFTEKIIEPDLWRYKVSTNKDYRIAQDKHGNVEICGNFINKLAEYEDAEENKTLLRLPCDIYDYLFAPVRDNISIFQAIGFEYFGYDIFVKWKIIRGITGGFQLDGIYGQEIGQRVFLTMEEAEKTLK